MRRCPGRQVWREEIPRKRIREEVSHPTSMVTRACSEHAGRELLAHRGGRRLRRAAARPKTNHSISSQLTQPRWRLYRTARKGSQERIAYRTYQTYWSE